MSQPKDFGFNEDVQMLKESFARFLAEQNTIESLRPSIRGTEDPIHGADRPAFYDEKAWQQCVELGMHAVSIPEAQGGQQKSCEPPPVVRHAIFANLPFTSAPHAQDDATC